MNEIPPSKATGKGPNSYPPQGFQVVREIVLNGVFPERLDRLFGIALLRFDRVRGQSWLLGVIGFILWRVGPEVTPLPYLCRQEKGCALWTKSVRMLDIR